ncbi:MAG: AbrB/MazE/SpoVT family DNA-binding domain-containing protein [Ardenticatenaceae bacterium]|nr:AbrB/MazE/SpoVT family DNA-binding domain-containing protein [Anaerolineales bacterium]MCB8922419.1 AbrB/MazE/SpoVT family DNA-binding domain-containing protein [Ardenticatenaceae bacterium]MCB8991351.1 AbrB/MazE/SpoVT family DNA-binding domain-containing protein [Ardenticatenaceae bacterium]MCB9005573.1 AbrB/MazE/SpoVT family DNA-binding domain-containing protein [Ardenticatenaceae bacterium]
MGIKLSSKGQLVIPKKIRRKLDLQPGTEFAVEVRQGQIILRPLLNQIALDNILDEMRQLVGDANLLDGLEAEHRNEIERDRQRESALSTG